MDELAVCPVCDREVFVEKSVPCAVMGLMLGRSLRLDEHDNAPLRRCPGSEALVFAAAKTAAAKRAA
jgi:hypothetical protein